MPTPRPHAIGRTPLMALGLATQEIAALLVAATMIGGVAAFVGPRWLTAAPNPPPSAQNDPLADGLRGMVESSLRVLGAHTEPLTGDTFVTLWGGDPDDPGRINRGELVVLHHSKIRRVVSAWVCAAPKDAFRGIGEPPPDTRSRRVRDDQACGEQFGPEWVIEPDIQRRVLATGVRDFRFERTSPPDRTPEFRIVLTRDAATTDGEPKELVVEAREGVAAAREHP